MDLYSNHPRVMLVAQPFSVNLHISSLPPTRPIGIGPDLSFGLLRARAPSAAEAIAHASDSALFASDEIDFFEELRLTEDPSRSRIMTPKAKAVLYMAMAMAFHFGGYEFARSATLALFTSKEAGFATPAAFPLAMAMITPISFLFLMGYTRDLEDNGPRLALRHSTLVSAAALLVTGLSLKFLEVFPVYIYSTVALSQLVVGLAFLFQNAYAHLLYAQQWSFLGSIMTPDEGSRWFASIAGISSVAAACSGTVVAPLVARLGLVGLLLCTSLTLVCSMLCAERAYATSQEVRTDTLCHTMLSVAYMLNSCIHLYSFFPVWF